MITPRIITAPPEIIFNELDMAQVLLQYIKGKETNGFSSTKLVAVCQNEDSTKQASDFINSSDESLIDAIVLRLGEVAVEGVGGNDSRHDSLVITKEQETRRGDGRDQKT